VHLEEAIEKLRADPGLIPQDDHGTLHARVESGQPGAQRAAHPRGVIRVDDHSGATPTDLTPNQRVVSAEDDHDVIEARAAGSRHHTL
jgi:hypothetical protein